MTDQPMKAEELDEIRARLRAALETAPILSKYHGHHGFEVERFIKDYEAWSDSTRQALDRLDAERG